MCARGAKSLYRGRPMQASHSAMTPTTNPASASPETVTAAPTVTANLSLAKTEKSATWQVSLRGSHKGNVAHVFTRGCQVEVVRLEFQWEGGSRASKGHATRNEVTRVFDCWWCSRLPLNTLDVHPYPSLVPRYKGEESDQSWETSHPHWSR